MAAYEVFFRESVWKELKKIPKADLKKILSRIEQLGTDPRPMGCEKLTDQEMYRISQGNYRIAYTLQDNAQTVRVVTVGHRKQVYR